MPRHRLFLLFVDESAERFSGRAALFGSDPERTCGAVARLCRNAVALRLLRLLASGFPIPLVMRFDRH